MHRKYSFSLPSLGTKKTTLHGQYDWVGDCALSFDACSLVDEAGLTIHRTEKEQGLVEHHTRLGRGAVPAGKSLF